MNDTRRFRRYPIQREAYYFLQEGQADGYNCTIVNVSRKGMGIIFHTEDEIEIGSSIRVEVPVATSFEPISVRGMLKWLEKMGSDYIGGVELTRELNDVKFSKLC